MKLRFSSVSCSGIDKFTSALVSRLLSNAAAMRPLTGQFKVQHLKWWVVIGVDLASSKVLCSIGFQFAISKVKNVSGMLSRDSSCSR